MAAIAPHLRPPGIGAVVGAMAQAGGGSLASALLAMVANKILATIAGPSGVAFFATLQQTRQTAVTAATLNGQTALIQGISARTGQARTDFIRTTLALLFAATALVVLILLLSPYRVARFVGLGAELGGIIRWLALPVALSSAFVFLSAFLNARGEIGRLAMLQVVSPAVLAVLSYPAAIAFRDGNALLLVASIGIAAAGSVIAACAAAGVAFGELHRRIASAARWWNSDAARRFFSVSASMLFTGLLGPASLLLVRSRILDTDGAATTGRFDAAWAISMNQVTLVLTSLQTFLLPALAASHGARQRSAHLSNALLVAIVVSAPVIGALVVVRPVLLALLYSPEFADATRFLRWTLVGDYLKVASWILSMPMLAAADMKAFVATDVTAYGTFIVSALLLTRWWMSAEAAAIAFVLMYAVHLAVCCFSAWKRHSTRPTGPMALVWLIGLILVGTTSAVFWEAR